MIRHRVGIAVTALVLLLSTEVAAADPVNLHMRTPSHLVTDGGSKIDLPPGHFLDDGSWSVLDVEMRRLQDQETRLKAENQKLRGTLAGWQPGWLLTTTVFVAGAVLGGYVVYKSL